MVNNMLSDLMIEAVNIKGNGLVTDIKRRNGIKIISVLSKNDNITKRGRYITIEFRDMLNKYIKNEVIKSLKLLFNANNITEVSSPKTSVIEVVDAPETQPEVQEEPQVETLKVKISAIGVEKLGNFRITGYCNDPMTASGKVPTVNHTIAMNNKQREELGLKYGQQLYITGDSIEGVFTLEDCGCGWNVVDVYCTNEAECCKITSYADVYIVVN